VGSETERDSNIFGEAITGEGGELSEEGVFELEGAPCGGGRGFS
jgi:hypothetical protein